MTRYQLSDLGGALSWGALLHFLQFVPRDSAFSQSVQPWTDAERWQRGEATAAILADIFDAVRALDADVMHKGTKRRPRQPKPYPRPWATDKGGVSVGKDPIPVSEFEAWWATPSKGGESDA